MSKDTLSYYNTLGLSPGATPLEIRGAYRQLIQRWHPDHFKAGSIMQTTAEDMTKELNEAYEQLYKKQLHRKFSPKGSSRKMETETEATATRAQRKAYQYEPPPPEPVRAKKARPDPPESAQPKPSPRRPAKSAAPEPAPSPTQDRPAAASRKKAGRKFRSWPWRKGVVVLGIIAAGYVLWTVVPDFRIHLPESETTLATKPSQPSPPRSSPAQTAVKQTVAKVAKNDNAPSPSPQVPAEVRPATAVITRIIQPPTSALPLASVTAEERPAVTPARITEWKRLLDDAESQIEIFERGDNKLKVLALQGSPEEATENVFRYGSSVVYFKGGLVTGWKDGVPRLHIRPELSIDYGLLNSFTVGSSRNEVVRAQGQPVALIPGGYDYGSSAVFFAGDRVTHWVEGLQPLHTGLLVAPLPFDNLDTFLRR